MVKITRNKLENLAQTLRPTERVPTAGGEAAEPVLAQLGARLDAAVLGGGSGRAGRTGRHSGGAARQRGNGALRVG